MSRWRIIGFVILCVVCIGGAAAYLMSAEDPASSGTTPSDDATPSSAASADEIAALLAAPHVVYRDTDLGSGFGRMAVAPLDRPDDAVVTDLACERVDYSGGRGICLTADRGAVTTYGATIFDEDLKTVATLDLPGLPSRTRVSADGRHGAMTTFVYGDSYAASTFSTRTQLLDLSTGESLGDLEEFTATKDGEVIDAVDRNYWGVTFGTGDEFYATLQTGGQRYLVKGDLATRIGRGRHRRRRVPVALARRHPDRLQAAQHRGPRADPVAARGARPRHARGARAGGDEQRRRPTRVARRRHRALRACPAAMRRARPPTCGRCRRTAAGHPSSSCRAPGRPASVARRPRRAPPVPRASLGFHLTDSAAPLRSRSSWEPHERTDPAGDWAG